MSITREEAARAIELKKELDAIIQRTGSKRLIRRSKSLHEAGNRWLKEHGFEGEIQTRGGDT